MGHYGNPTMPQPLKKFSCPVEFGWGVIDLRPALGVRIASIAAASAHLEMRLGLLLAALLRAEAKAGVAMYLSLSGTRSRYAALRGAAEHRLDKGDRDNFTQLSIQVRSAQGRRNKVVHAMWGTSADKTDALIRADPREMATDLADRTIPPHIKRMHATYVGSAKSARLMVWKERDFAAVEQAVSDALDAVGQFTALVLHKYA